MRGYGILKQTKNSSELESHLEELDIVGFTILPNVLKESELVECRERVEKVYREQEEKFGRQSLETINELNVARCLLAYDEYFLNLLKPKPVTEMLNAVFGENYVLALQNSIISQSGQVHHQSSWHRDIPYQDYVVSQPIGLNIYFCLDNYDEKSGSTVVLPFSHRLESMPSKEYVEKYQVSSTVNAGSVIVFNSWLYHRAGMNRSGKVRRGINHLYTVPVIRQQLDLPRLLGDKYRDDPKLRKVLGYEWEVPVSVDDWRERRLEREKNR